MSSKDRQERLVENMKRWQKIENASVLNTGKIVEKTDNPIIRMVAEVIQRDSQNHYHVQQMIIDSLEKESLSLTPEEISEVWDLIEEHIQVEKSTIEIAEQSLEDLKGLSHLTPQLYLLNYLLKDEEKHDYLLEALEQVKRDIYPYA